MSQVIAITGPTGSGKTTIGDLLASSLGSFVNIDADHIKHMNPGAFTKIINENCDEDWLYSKWGLVGENIGLLAKNFISHGYKVIINGYLEAESWQEIEKQIKIDKKYLLLPELKINLERDNKRTSEIRMGEDAVQKGRRYFQSASYYKDFIVIDSSDQTAKETAQYIKNRL